MSNKTAMQELIHWLKSGWKDEDIDTVLKKTEQLLEMERQQIDKAYFAGLIDGMNNEHRCYYLETYNVNSNVIRLICDCEPHTFYEWEKMENNCSKCNKSIYEQ